MQAGCNPIVITLSAKNLRHFSNNQSTRHQNRFTPVGVAKLDAFLFSTGMTKTKLWVGLGSWFPRSRTRDPSATLRTGSGAPLFRGEGRKGKGKNNCRSFGFAQDDKTKLWVGPGSWRPAIKGRRRRRRSAPRGPC